MDDLYRISVKTIKGDDSDLSTFKNHVLLIVNTASKCGFTPQYEGLEKLYRMYEARGFAVLGFPCNQFLNQEPGDENEIDNFCKLTFGVTFPMYAKVEVNGDKTHPLFAQLKERAPGFLGINAVKWNFTKFLVGRKASCFKRFSPNTSPDSLQEEIESLLGNS
ncbi:MAG: glutathione peroxidase [Candidatus Riflebacteria bacterium]|nr:glutathione peroxidase [Candidatus Riflebacteria bacterium]